MFGGRRSDQRRVAEDLDLWRDRRTGVEAFVEPRTAVTELTVILVDTRGAFIRRRIPSTAWIKDFGRERAIPVYDATTVGYPARLRDYVRRAQRATGSVDRSE